uniref:Outer capsid protein VP2 n=1 Tax=Epizootic hemorrhagic disease virus 6 TaxID=238101 RepID=A0A2Z6BDT8_9REOV|nr:VP2 protein [Epizootic hemorrhagic disease virus 6]BDY02943.1 VP2 protein [Epizootic hemorrhagic disease virus 6]
MESIEFAIINKQQQPDESVIYDYLTTIQARTYDEKLRGKVEHMINKSTIELTQGEARNFLDRAISDEYRINFPDAVNYGIMRYDDEHERYNEKGMILLEHVKPVGEYEIMLRTSVGHQRVKPEYGTQNARITFQFSGGDLRIHSKFVESLKFEIVNYETEDCDHTRWKINYDMLLEGGLMIGAGTCYDLLKQLELIVIGEIKPSTRERQNVITRQMIPVGTPEITNREPYKNKQTKIQAAFGPRVNELKKEIFSGKYGLEVKHVARLLDDPLITRLDVIAEEWMQRQSDEKVDEICDLLEAKGKQIKAAGTNTDYYKKARARLHGVLKANLVKTTDEIGNIRAVRNENAGSILAAVLVVSACDSQKRAIWYNDDSPIYRGVMLYATEKFGSVYYGLRRRFTWSIRPTYVDSCPRVCDRRQTFMTRIPYFDLNQEEGDSIYKWNLEPILRDVKTTRMDGYPYEAYDGDDEDAGLVHDIDQRKYHEMIQRIIDNEWQEKDGIATIISDVGGIEKYDFTKDAYIDEAGFIKLPDYYEKQIRSKLYGYSFKITRVSITASKTEDPWHQKTVGKLISEDELWRVPLDGIVDVTQCLSGRAISDTKQKRSVRFDELLEEDDDGEKGECVQKYVLEKIRKKLFTRVFSILKWYFPTDYIDSLIGEDEYVYDTEMFNDIFNEDEFINEHQSLSSMILSMIIRAYKDEKVDELQNSTTYLYRMMERQGKEREAFLKKSMPKFYAKILKVRKAEKIEDILPFIFLQALLTSIDLQNLDKRVSLPFILFCKEEERIIPISFKDSLIPLPLLQVLHIMRFHPGEERRREQVGAEIREILPKLLDFWFNVAYERKTLSAVEHISEQYVKNIVCSYCGGNEIVASFILPITHPEKGFIVVIATTEDVANSNAEAVVKSRFSEVAKYIKGVVHISITQDGVARVRGGGGIKSRILEKVVLGTRFQLVQIKMGENVFENHELVTKLMN